MLEATTQLGRVPVFVWLKNGWDSEVPRAIHRYGGYKTAGPFTDGFLRILDDRFIRWYTEIDVATGKPKRDERGHYVMYRLEPHREDDLDDWVMPMHEAVKRMRGHGPKPALEWYWLREILAWRGLPCPCGHDGIVECIAARSRARPAEVVGAVLRLSRSIARLIGDGRDASCPKVAG